MKLTNEEITGQKMTAEHVEEAKQMLMVEGYVVLESVLSARIVEALHNEFIELLEESHRLLGDNRGKQRQGGVPVVVERAFADPDVLGNGLALDVIADLLGGDVVCSYYSSDTPLPGSEYQPAHQDGEYLFPGLTIAVPPYMYELNIPLVDFRTDNGPVEVWPGTHLVPDVRLIEGDGLEIGDAEQLRQRPVQRFAERLSPVPVTMPRGSFLLRDPRVWHRGTPNRSDYPRPMLSIAYGRPWYRFNAVCVAQSVYAGWPERLRRVFRLACIEGEHSREFGVMRGLG